MAIFDRQKLILSRQIIVLFSLFLILNQPVFSQKVKISGYVLDSIGKEPIPFANIQFPYLHSGITCNEFGYFSTEILHQNISSPMLILLASHVGYNTQKIELQPLNQSAWHIEIFLKRGIELSEIDITANKYAKKNAPIDLLELNQKTIKSLPKLLGENDLIKAFQFLPGVQSSSEGSSNLIIRGGNSDQNLYIVDGVPIYYISHYQGLFSVFDENAISNVRLLKGSFPAKYSGRLSSIVEINLKNGNHEKMQLNLNVGLISSKITINGPIYKDKTSFIFSIRRSNLDLFMRAASSFLNNNRLAAYTFYDSYFKVNHQFKKGGKIFLSTYFGDDIFKFRAKSVIKQNDKDYLSESTFLIQNNFGSKMATLKYYKAISNSVFNSTTFSILQYRYNLLSSYSIENIENKKIDAESSQVFESNMLDFKLSSDFDFALNEKHTINYGINAIHHKFNPGGFRYYSSGINIDTTNKYIPTTIINTSEASIYLEDEWTLNSKTSIKMGINNAAFFSADTFYYSFEPRLSVKVDLAKNISLFSSFTKMTQFLHLISSSNINMPFDLWFPSSKNILPETAYQYSIGFKTATPFENTQLSIDSYFKKMNNLLTFKDGNSFAIGSSNWEQRLEKNGKGTAYGVEFLLESTQTKFNYWISYTWAKSYRQFPNINYGKAYYYQYDRRHTLSAVAIFEISPKVSFSANWLFYTGNLLTVATQKYVIPYEHNTGHDYDYDQNTIYYYPQKNNFRLPNYHRLDINLTLKKQKKNAHIEWNFSVLNLYNRKNPYYYYYDYNSKSELSLHSLTIFPILPSISYSYSF